MSENRKNHNIKKAVERLVSRIYSKKRKVQTLENDITRPVEVVNETPTPNLINNATSITGPDYAPQPPNQNERLSIGNISTFLQIFSIIVGGIWVVLMYFDQKKQNQLLTIETQLNIKSHLLEEQMKEFSFKFEKDIKIKFDDSCSLRKIKDIDGVYAQYKCTLKTKFTNRSSNKSEITYSIVDVYTAGDKNLDKVSKDFATMSDPPTAFFLGNWIQYQSVKHPFKNRGKTQNKQQDDSTYVEIPELNIKQFDWQPRYHRYYLYSDQKDSVLSDVRFQDYNYNLRLLNEKIDGHDSGGLTGVYMPDESDDYSFTFFIIARHDDLIAVTYAASINMGKRQEDLRSRFFVKDMRDAK